MQVNIDDIMGLSEVSEMTGKSKANIKEYQKRGQFPEPVKILASGPLWLRDKIQTWMDTPRQRGRKKKED
ncbi:AlpA family transcriptional regulator [uncultured Brevibacillus sp.]|uniref:helix-turn-helix transcriptional regulator n=1 Tax=uncultured Brevibacillus sp. TaxID=169970 RepID=UPI002595010A|nr:AlpA family phage regulatory protein [uncultured Brevibacillus sp.]